MQIYNKYIKFAAEDKEMPVLGKPRFIHSDWTVSRSIEMFSTEEGEMYSLKDSSFINYGVCKKGYRATAAFWKINQEYIGLD